MFLSENISYYIISLGCSKNLVDSEKINGALYTSGFQKASTRETADIVIINTCGFIEDAKRESIDVIFDVLDNIIKEGGDNNNSASSQKGKGFEKKIVVMGCLSKRYFNEIKKDIPEIDFLYGSPDEEFVNCLSREFNINLCRKSVFRQKSLYNNLPYAYIKISEGCSNNCSYCAIPLIKGQNISFSPDLIIEDVKTALDNGALELIFVAQDAASYFYNGHNIRELIDRISYLDKVNWIRLLYFHPDNINDDIIDLLKRNENVVKYIDVPFQHVSKKILSSMGRRGTFKEYERLVKTLRREVPSISIRSTFMIGYPGETSGDFNELHEFIKSVELDRVGCFIYSREENTRAALIKDKTSMEIKKERLEKLMETQKVISRKRLQKFVGKNLDILVESRIDENRWLGRTEYDAPEVDGVFFLTADGIRTNTIVKARVTDASDYDLTGELI